jgi:hypothetical protein
MVSDPTIGRVPRPVKKIGIPTSAEPFVGTFSRF